MLITEYKILQIRRSLWGGLLNPLAKKNSFFDEFSRLYC
jgi:hypothetical protein